MPPQNLITATSTDISVIPVRNCDTPVIKREIALPRSPKSLGRAECARPGAMPQPLRSRRSYDHRIREIVCQTGNPRIFHHLRIPRSPTASWLSRGRPSVVCLDWTHDIASVLDENEKLRRRTERQTAIIRLLVVLLKLSGFRLDDRSSCPRSHPTQLTPTEVSTIKHMVMATEYRHMPPCRHRQLLAPDLVVAPCATPHAHDDV